LEGIALFRAERCDIFLSGLLPGGRIDKVPVTVLALASARTPCSSWPRVGVFKVARGDDACFER
jgi:hypothetical protein